MSQDLGEVATGTDFVRELQSLRERSGLTIREVARAAGTSVSTTGDCFSGRHLPLDKEQFARILAACGETSAERVEAWQAALARVRRSPGRRGEPPYRGLARFEADDERWFFGREDFTELIAFLAEQRSDLPLMLVGPSGAGKSSLLRAGLLPRLRAAAEEAAPGSAALIEIYDLTVTGTAGLAQRVIEAVSGGSPLSGSRGRSGARDSEGAPGRPALIVDQFEALFTLCPDEGERSALISALCDLAKTRLVVLALRADFYGQAIGHPGLLRALQERHVLLAPMSAEQLRRAVVEPARLARTDVEDGLVEVVLADLAPAAADRDAAGQAHEQGTLPLLSHAMRSAWEHSRGGTMTVADYLASGGIKDAVTQSAERAYDSLTPEQQRLFRRLLLRLVHVADELPPSRASVPLSELRGAAGTRAGDGDGDADADTVLDVFVRERMITVDADSAQFTHDALLTAWPRLRAWIDENAEALRTRRRIAEGARTWAEADREEAALWRGSQLAIAREWAADKDRRATLSPAALAFIDASVAAGTTRERRERRRLRRLRGIVAVLAALVLVVAGLTLYTARLRQQALSAGHTAIVDGQAANSRAVAFVADEKRGEDPAVSAQLAAAAYSISQTPQATASLLEASGTPEVTRAEDSADIVQWVSLSPDRRLLIAAGADGTLRLWNITKSEHPIPVATLAQVNSEHPLYTAAFSPDGTLIAAAGAEQVVRLWKVTGTSDAPRLAVIKQPMTGPGGTIYSVAFSPDGKTLAAGSDDGSVWLWNVGKPGHAGSALTVPGSRSAVNSVAFGAGGQVLAAGTSAGTVMLWRVRGSGEPVRYPHMPLTGPGGHVSGVAFSPDGQTLAASSQDDKVWLWTVRRSKKSGSAASAGTLTGATNWANTVAFSPDGTSLAAGTSAASVLVWNLATRALTATVPQPQPVTSVSWDGSHLIAASNADGTFTLVRLPSPILATGNSPASVAYSPDGKTIAVGGTSVQLWDAAKRTLLAVSPLPPSVYVNATAFGHGVIAVALRNGKVSLLSADTLAPLAAPFPVTTGTGNAAESVAFSPDGTLLATGADDGSVRLYNVADPANPRRLVTERASGESVYTVAFAPDGKTVAEAGLDRAVRLWRVTGSGSAAGLSPVGSPLRDMASYAIGLAFSPDSKTLAVGSADKTVHLWNVADPAHPVLLGPALTGPSGYVWAAAFSPSGQTLAVGATDGSVWLWNVASPAHPVLIATLSGPANHVYGLAFSPSGAQLAATSFEGTVHLWDTSPAEALAGICAVTGQRLTAAEWASYVPGVPYRAACP